MKKLFKPLDWEAMSVGNKINHVKEYAPTVNPGDVLAFWNSSDKPFPISEADTITVTREELKTFYEDAGGEFSNSSFRLAEFIGLDPNDGV